MAVSPRRVLGDLLVGNLPADEPDAVLVRVEFVGDGRRLRYDIIDRYDESTGLSEGQIRMLPVPARLRLARSAPRLLRSFLLRDPNPRVANSVAKRRWNENYAHAAFRPWRAWMRSAEARYSGRSWPPPSFSPPTVRCGA